MGMYEATKGQDARGGAHGTEEDIGSARGRREPAATRVKAIVGCSDWIAREGDDIRAGGKNFMACVQLINNCSASTRQTWEFHQREEYEC